MTSGLPLLRLQLNLLQPLLLLLLWLPLLRSRTLLTLLLLLTLLQSQGSTTTDAGWLSLSLWLLRPLLR